VHRRHVIRAAGIVAASLAATLLPTSVAAAATMPAQVLLPGNRIVVVDAANGAAPVAAYALSGVTAGDQLVGIDRRPSDGFVYGVGRADSGTRLYRIDGSVATLVATLNVAGAPLVLDGTSFGVDVNPAANALRIVSDTGQNLRVTPAGFGGTGGAGATGATLVDTTLNENGMTPAVGVSAAAYDRNDNDATTGTTLYDLDSVLDRVVTQGGVNGTPSPNAGTLLNPVAISRTTTAAAGFDILTVGASNVAYAVLTQEQGSSGVSRLVTVDLASGRVDVVGALGNARSAIGLAL
jgi:Domain of unknown function (DUF4394)